MSRVFPFPILTIALFLMWLLLTQSFSAGQLFLGAIIATLASLTMRSIKPHPIRIRTLRPAMRLLRTVMIDVMRSNAAVLSITLRPGKERVSGFVRVPIELTDRNAITVLALIITATPGTMWIQFDQRRQTLLVHVFDLIDEDAWIKLIKERYEASLMQIFEQ